MIVEQRTYQIIPGKVPEYVGIYEQRGLSVQTRHLPRMLGWFFTEIGELNQIVHIWGYEDLAERTRSRAALVADPDWRAALAELLPLITHMETKIMVPAAFSPIR